MEYTALVEKSGVFTNFDWQWNRPGTSIGVVRRIKTYDSWKCVCVCERVREREREREKEREREREKRVYVLKI